MQGSRIIAAREGKAAVAGPAQCRVGVPTRNRVPKQIQPKQLQKKAVRAAHLQPSAAFVDAPTVAAGNIFVNQQHRGQQAVDCGRDPLISWAGAGIFFFWQLGAYKFLRNKYDLTRVQMIGASGGALCAILAACNVDPDVVLQSAYELSCQQNVWERPLGLLGIWGPLIESWLDNLLPPDACELCDGKTTLVVTTVPHFRQVGINRFHDRKHLIDVAMASAHVPFLLDWNLGRTVRGQLYFDGSLPDFVTQDNCELLKSGGRAVIFDYSTDTNLLRTGRLDMLELKKYEEVQRLMHLGYEYAKKKYEEGEFQRFDMPRVTRA